MAERLRTSKATYYDSMKERKIRRPIEVRSREANKERKGYVSNTYSCPSADAIPKDQKGKKKSKRETCFTLTRTRIKEANQRKEKSKLTC